MANGYDSRVYDKFSAGYISPPMDADSNVEATYRFYPDDYIRFTLTRPLDTGDIKNDFLIPVEQEWDLGWSVNEKSSNLLQKHTQASAFRALLKLDGTDSFSPSNLSEGAAPAVFAPIILAAAVAIYTGLI